MAAFFTIVVSSAAVGPVSATLNGLRRDVSVSDFKTWAVERTRKMSSSLLESGSGWSRHCLDAYRNGVNVESSQLKLEREE